MLLGMLVALAVLLRALVGTPRLRQPAPRRAVEDDEASGFFDEGLAGAVATWIAALVTIGVWAYLVGERRFFQLAQHLLAGLATGYWTVLAVREVLIPRLIEPLYCRPGRPAAAGRRWRWCWPWPAPAGCRGRWWRSPPRSWSPGWPPSRWAVP